MKYIVTESQFQNAVDKLKGFFQKSKSSDSKSSQSNGLLDEKPRNKIINHFFTPDDIEYFDSESDFAFIKNGKVIMFTGVKGYDGWVYADSDIINTVAAHMNTDITTACDAINRWLDKKYNMSFKTVTPFFSKQNIDSIRNMHKIKNEPKPILTLPGK